MIDSFLVTYLVSFFRTFGYVVSFQVSDFLFVLVDPYCS